MEVAPINRLLPAEMLDLVFHLLAPRDQARAVEVCTAWNSMANQVLLAQAKLPPNILLRVFHLLPPRDLKAVVLVCRWWREVGEAMLLWLWVNLTVQEQSIGYMPEVLDSRRLQAVRRMEVRQVRNMSEELLQAVVRHPGLREMAILYTDLSSVNPHVPQLLAQAVNQMEEANLYISQLTPQQVTAICTAMAEGSKLKTLNLSCTNLSSVDADILARAVTRLEEVWLGCNELTPHQVEAIFAALSTSSQLKTLDLGGNNLSAVDAKILAQPVTQLEEVNLYKTQLTPEQVTAICTAIAGDSQLKTLELTGSDLSRVDAEILAKAITKLEEVELVNTQMTPQQVEAIFAALNGPTQLKRLIISANNLSTVDPRELALAVNKLEEVWMDRTSLSKQQVVPGHAGGVRRVPPRDRRARHPFKT